MTNWYVRKSGNDNNDGLTPSTAWATIQRSLIAVDNASWSSSTATVLTVGNIGYTSSMLIGAKVEIVTAATAGVGTYGYITANGTTSITVSSWVGTTPSGGGTYRISGPQSGDTVYIGPGYYNSTLNTTYTFFSPNPTSAITYYGDTLGNYTGDTRPGEVLLTNWTYSMQDPRIQTNTMTLSLQDPYLTFQNMSFFARWSPGAVYAGSIATDVANITFRNCIIQSDGGNYAFRWEQTPRVANLTIENCYIESLYTGSAGYAALYLLLSSASSPSSFDANISVKNCVIVSAQDGIYLGTGSSNTYYSGGVRIDSCTVKSPVGIRQGTNVDQTYPSSFKNCLLYAGTPVACSTSTNSRALVDLGGNYGTGTNLNYLLPNPASAYVIGLGVTLNTGFEAIVGLPPQQPLSPRSGGYSLPVNEPQTTDMLGRANKDGSIVVYDSGTLTASSTTTVLNDTTKSWGVNEHRGRMVWLPSLGEAKYISSNTATALTLYVSSSAVSLGALTASPSTGNAYTIFSGPPSTKIALGGINNSAGYVATNGTILVDGRWNGARYFHSNSSNLYRSIVRYNSSTQLTVGGGTVQTVNLGYATQPVSGSMYLCFKGYCTTAIAYNATAATIQAALEALPSIGAGNVSVATPSYDASTTTIVMTLQGTLASNTVDYIYCGHSNANVTSAWVNGTGSTTTGGTPIMWWGDAALPTASAFYTTPGSAGALVPHDTAVVDSSVTDSDSYSIALDGVASQDFKLPVTAAATMVQVKVRWTNSLITQKPTITIVADSTIGIANDQTATAIGDGSYFETVSLTFTPTTAGVATLRLAGQAEFHPNRTYFDTISVSLA